MLKITSSTGENQPNNPNIFLKKKKAGIYSSDRNFPLILDNLLNKTLTIIVGLGGVALLNSLVRFFYTGFQPIYVFHIFCYLLIIIIFNRKDKIAFETKAHILNTIFLLLGTFGLIRLGTLGIAPISLFIFCILSTIFFNIEGGLIATLISSLVFTVTGFLFASGYLHYNFDINNFLYSGGQWIFKVLTFNSFTLVIVYLLGSIQRYLYENNILLQQEIDIRTKVEKQIKKSEENYRKLVEDVNVIVWNAIPDPLGFTFISKEAEKLLGYSTERWIADPDFWKDHIHPDDRDYAINFCLESTENLKDHEFEYRMFAANGKIIWLRDIVRVIIKDNKASELVGVMVDITAQKQAEEELNKINDELDTRVKQRTIELELRMEELKTAQDRLVHSEKMASLGVLTAGIAHEINNPINYISASFKGLNIIIDSLLKLMGKYEEITIDNLPEKIKEIDGLKQKMDFEDMISGIKELSGNIEIGVNRTSEIIKGLSNFSRNDEQVKLKFGVNENIDLTLALLHNQLDNGKIKIRTEYGRVEDIICHPGKVNQVFMNLLANAIDAIKSKNYLSDNDVILIKTSMEKRPDGEFVKILISDTGVGIPENIENRIFEPFFTTKEVGKGTGLGLAITTGIIKSHGGSIEFKNYPGTGTTFTILLPVEEEPD